MKVKTSVTLSPNLLQAIDRRCSEGDSRSEFLEKAAWDVIRRADKAERDARDTEILNAIAAGKFGEVIDPQEVGVSIWELGDEFTDEDLVHGAG